MNLLEMIKRSGNVADRNILSTLLDGAIFRLGDPKYYRDQLNNFNGSGWYNEPKWPFFGRYALRHRVGDRYIPFENEVVVAPKKQEAVRIFEGQNPQMRNAWLNEDNFKEIPGPLPREYYPSYTEQEFEEAAYPFLANEAKQDLAKAEEEKAALEPFIKNCKEGENLIVGKNTYPCGSHYTKDALDNANYIISNEGDQIRGLPNIPEEVDIDPMLYVDSPVPLIRNRALKLINGED